MLCGGSLHFGGQRCRYTPELDAVGVGDWECGSLVSALPVVPSGDPCGEGFADC